VALAFHEQSFADRQAGMGDLAEDAFKLWADRQGFAYADWGLKRPPFKRFWNLPALVKVAPDYVCEGKRHFFVECKGKGKGALKIKLESLAGLDWWNDQMTVWFFVNDSVEKQYAFLPYRAMQDICYSSPIRRFHDGKHYYHIKPSRLTWNPLGV
jgi:hypothetical protein